MKPGTKPAVNWSVLIAVLVLLIGAGLTWLWFDKMERRWTARVKISEAAARDQMLAASMLLRQNGHPVRLAGSLADLSLADMPDGTVLVGDGVGVLTPPKAAQLLAWVRRGNTLITQPRPATPAELTAAGAGQTHPGGPIVRPEPPADLVEVDPVAALLGVRQHFVRAKPMCDRLTAPEPGKNCRATDTPPPSAYLTLPGADHRMELEGGSSKLLALPGAPAPQLQDADGSAVRVYRLGRGRVVMLSDNFFDNRALKRYDHGELLLALATLQPGSKPITVVKHFDAIPWYQELWRYARLMLISLALVLALLLWKALRRFGPRLPRPLQERRSLVEHIDASGAWLWKAQGGRALLLDAARADTLALIRRRTPAALSGAPAAINSELAITHGMSEATIDAALHQPASHLPQRFTRQIRTLQIMRKHYERH